MKASPQCLGQNAREVTWATACLIKTSSVSSPENANSYALLHFISASRWAYKLLEQRVVDGGLRLWELKVDH